MRPVTMPGKSIGSQRDANSLIPAMLTRR